MSFPAFEPLEGRGQTCSSFFSLHPAECSFVRRRAGRKKWGMSPCRPLPCSPAHPVPCVGHREPRPLPFSPHPAPLPWPKWTPTSGRGLDLTKRRASWRRLWGWTQTPGGTQMCRAQWRMSQAPATAPDSLPSLWETSQANSGEHFSRRTWEAVSSGHHSSVGRGRAPLLEPYMRLNKYVDWFDFVLKTISYTRWGEECHCVCTFHFTVEGLKFRQVRSSAQSHLAGKSLSQDWNSGQLSSNVHILDTSWSCLHVCATISRLIMTWLCS